MVYCLKKLFTDVFSLNIECSLGDGRKFKFWWDKWANGLLFKKAFPRIFALFVNKEGKVQEFGEWSNNKWYWRLLLRRRLFGWELHQWHVLCSFLKGFVIYDSLKDEFIWKGSTSAVYSVNHFCKAVLKTESSVSELWSLIWSGLAPPKVEVFCWQVMRGRIAMKE
ncbi:hypothetical protein CRYUN_Cryun18bG0103100 [Craigia yunnanensis]